jgi:MFS family permease
VKGVLLTGMWAWTLRYALFAYGFDGQTTYMWMLVVGVLLHGVCYDFFFVASQIYIDEQFDSALRTRAQAFLVFINMGIGVIIGANLANAVYAFNTVSPTDHGWRAIWLVPAVIALVVGALFAVLFKSASPAHPACPPSALESN